jgi:hypothetical protein
LLRIRRLVVIALVCVVGVWFGAVPASAHSGKQSYLYLSLFDDGVEGRVEIPAVDLGRAIDVDLVGAPGGVGAASRAASEQISAYVDQHFSLGDASGTWSTTLGDLSVLGTENGPYVVVPFVVTDEFANTPRNFIAEFDAIIESDPEKDALLIIEDDWQSAVFDNGSEPLLGFSEGRTVQEVALADAGALSSMAAIRGIGSDAVRVTVDVMFIVAALVAAVVLLPSGRSRSDLASTGELLRRARNTALSFAGALVVGTGVMGLGVEDPPDRAVGILMGLTLASVSVYALVARFRPGARSALAWLAAAAGLVVGLELGTVFLLQQLDRSRPIASLVAFLAGALLAIGLVALFVGVPLHLLRRTRYATFVFVALEGALVVFGLAWTGERVIDHDWPIEEFANPFRVWPRNAWFVLLAVAIAALVRSVEARAGRIRPVGPQPSDVTEPVTDQVQVG